MKRIGVCGVGNGITDIIVKVDLERFNTFGLKCGSFQLVSREEQGKLLSALESEKMNLVSGGAVCNSIIIAQQLGADTAMICRLGDDKYGLHYQEELSALGVAMDNPPIVRERSGTSVIMVTPDGERTMSTCLNASADLGSGDISEQMIADSEWVFIEGYLIGNGEQGQAAVRRTIELAKKHGCKIALTLAAPFIVDVFRPVVKELLPSIDLAFANHEESMVYSQVDSLEESIALLSKQVPHIVVTAGADGVHIVKNGDRSHVPAFPCTPVDLTGAGDAFAGGYLYGMHSGLDVETAATGACNLAMKVITRIGARLQSGTRDYWNEVVNVK